MIDQNEVTILFEYREGQLFNRVDRGSRIKAGTKAGSVSSLGYWIIKVGQNTYKEHRLIWLYHHGECPEYLDHVNNIRTDNRIENLQPVSLKDNARKKLTPSRNTSGFKGVSLAPYGRWKYGLRVGDKTYGGYADTKEQAAVFYNQLAVEHYGAFALVNEIYSDGTVVPVLEPV